MDRRRFTLNAVQSLALSFACLILLGALLLMLPWASRDRGSLPFLDALFTRQAPVSESFYICEDGICFIYGQYQLGPYYLGCLEIMLSWDEVSDILKQ